MGLKVGGVAENIIVGRHLDGAYIGREGVITDVGVGGGCVGGFRHSSSRCNKL